MMMVCDKVTKNCCLRRRLAAGCNMRGKQGAGGLLALAVTVVVGTFLLYLAIGRGKARTAAPEQPPFIDRRLPEPERGPVDASSLALRIAHLASELQTVEHETERLLKARQVRPMQQPGNTPTHTDTATLLPHPHARSLPASTNTRKPKPNPNPKPNPPGTAAGGGLCAEARAEERRRRGCKHSATWRWWRTRSSRASCRLVLIKAPLPG